MAAGMDDYSREELGLPPAVSWGRRAGAEVFWLVLTLAAAAAAGTLAGRTAYRSAEMNFLRDARQSAGLEVPDELRAALRTLQARRGALARSLPARLALAEALCRAAAVLPEAPWSYWQDARQELAGARALLPPPPPFSPSTESPDPDAPPSPDFAGELAPTTAGAGVYRRTAARAWAVESMYGAVLLDLGEDRDALAALTRAEYWRQHWDEPGHTYWRRDAMNSLAYLLAIARDPAVRRPEESLRLAKAMLTEPLPPPDADADGEDGGGAVREDYYPTASAALVDTLASAYMAVGAWPEAREAQRLALGLADADDGDLSVYLRRYRAIESALSPSPSPHSARDDGD